MIRTSAIFFLFTFIFNSFVSAQVKRQYRQHEVIDAGNGLKIEILQCRGEGENAECDIIYYTEKRQQGKRQWEKVSKISEQEQGAKKGLTQNNQSSNKSLPPTKKEKSEPDVVPDTTTATTSLPAKQREKKSDDSLAYEKAKEKKLIQNSSNTAHTYTLQQCFLLALEKNTALKKAENNVSLNIIDHKTAQYNLFPSLSYDLGHYFSFGKNIDPVTNTFVNQNFSGGYSAVGLQLDLFSGFNRLNTIKQTSYQISAAEYAKKRIELELLTNVTLTYARLLLNNDQLMIARSNILSTSNQLDVINEKIKVGRLTRYEAYAFDARLNTEKANFITIQNDSTAASADLKHLLNLPYKQQINIAPIDTTTLSNIYATTISITDFIDIILLNHPAIKQAKMEEQVAQAGLKIAKGNLYPSLSIAGNIVTNYNADQLNLSGQKIPLGQQLSDNIGKNINISLHIPIFSQMQNANLIKKQKINISNAQLNIQDAENLIVTNTLQLINDFNSSRQKYTATSLAYNQNILSYSMYEEKYKLGQISSFEMFTARDLLNTAASQYLQAKLELFFRYQLLQLLKK
jgi:outer membrane protein